jgi:hypothetical protein
MIEPSALTFIGEHFEEDLHMIALSEQREALLNLFQRKASVALKGTSNSPVCEDHSSFANHVAPHPPTSH